ncbi:MAG TPA: hypothetical protein VFJ06_02675 [Halococcus sp.]|nr:hypothetical protein [Halococcus sp.]
MPAKVSTPADEYREIDRFDGGIGWIAHPEEILQRASHALETDDGVWLIDPLDAEGIDDRITELGTVAGVVVLSNHHRRDGAAIANRHDVPVYLPRAMQGVAETLDAPVEHFEGELAGYELLTVNFVSGWQEFALYDGETLIVSESVGTAPHFLTDSERLGVITLLRPLPPRATLGGLDPERILLGHGEGVFEDAAAALTDALSGSRRRFPRALIENGSDQFRTLTAVLFT